MFHDQADGALALRQQIDRNLFRRRLSILEFFAGNGSYPGYAPDVDGNDPEAYARRVADELRAVGIFGPITTKFRTLGTL